jgi:hypothetical protein
MDFVMYFHAVLFVSQLLYVSEGRSKGEEKKEEEEDRDWSQM